MTTLIGSLLETLRRPRRPEEGLSCPRCGAPGSLVPVDVALPGGLAACRACGTLADAAGRALAPCPRCTWPAGDRGEDRHPCVPEGTAPGEPPGEAELEDLLPEVTGRPVETERLEDYVAGVLERLSPGDEPARVHLLDGGEPLVCLLPGGRRLVCSLGLLALLEDEAQLAWVLAREVFLAGEGLVARRFAGVRPEGRGGLLSLFRGGSRRTLRDALLLSLLAGWGPELERRADFAALGIVARAGWDPRRAAGVPALLEPAALEGAGCRFAGAAARCRDLREEAALLLRRPASLVNREVYRRAVGGFAVFAAP